MPATVGSPVNLLTPDRYEFYTFDESGELVKRLMTLEEIQAIVAAGEETDGLVTFANDNQPTVAFNFSQPSHTKVHSVVTNVQNVLKSQMEAHKNKPNIQPTFDTPDVSDSWSLILPSIFGNTGVDIVPDKATGSFITPETETIDVDNLNMEYENSQSKESNEIPTISTSEDTNKNNNGTKIPVTELSYSSTESVTTELPVSPTTIPQPSTTLRLATTTSKQFLRKTTSNPTVTTTTSKPKLSSTMTTVRPSSTMSATSMKPTMNSSIKPTISDFKNKSNVSHQSEIISHRPSTVNSVQYEKISTFSPISIGAYVTEKTKLTNNEQNKLSHKNMSAHATISSSTPTENTDKNEEHISTTVATYSTTHSTTTTSKGLIPTQNNQIQNNNLISSESQGTDNIKEENPTSLPLFDVAQSISQIASDLGNNFVPIPTSNSLLDATKVNNGDIESKENVEIEIPTESGTGNETKTTEPENFVKISTFDPQVKNEMKKEEVLDTKEAQTTSLPSTTTTEQTSTSTDTMDPILTDSMGDLLSQVAQNIPDPTSIVFTENSTTSNELFQQTDENIYSNNETLSVVTTTSRVIVGPPVVVSPTNKERPEKNITEKIPTIKDVKENLSTKAKNVTKMSSNKNIDDIKYESDLKKYNTSNEKTSNNMIKINHKNSNNTQEKNKIVLDQNNNTTNGSTNSILTLGNKVGLSTFIDSTTESNIITSAAPAVTMAQQNNKVSNKLQKLETETPKFDEFKKKIQKVNIDEKELANERNNSWKLISTVTPPKVYEPGKDKHKVEGFYIPDSNDHKDIILEFSKENQGLEVTTKDIGEDVLQFTELCNELAFKYWSILTENVDKKRSFIFSPYSITSMLAMMFMGAKGATSGEMNEVLRLDDMVTFNPHFILKNISDSIETTSASGVAVSGFIRELYSDRSRGKILTFYKERAQHFYNGHVEEVNFKLISDIIRRRTNLLVKRYTWGKIPEFMKTNSIVMNPPLAAFSANIFYVSIINNYYGNIVKIKKISLYLNKSV